MVGKSIYDGSWYLVEEAYRQGALVEGGWPRGRNGKEIPELEVAVDTISDGGVLRLGFKCIKTII